MIHVEGLRKIFPSQADPKSSIVAVEDLSLRVDSGKAFAFLGPNGAGKTTTVRMLCTLIAPTKGRAEVAGLVVGADNDKIRSRVGILTETPGLYERLSAEQNLRFFAELYGVPHAASQIDKYLGMLGLLGRKHDAVGGFSKGMRQKLAIARALLHEPEVLFLDEPTSGLDPEASRFVRDFILDLKRAGRTLFLCTHNLEEAERICDRIGIFRTRLLTIGTPEELRRQIFRRTVVVHTEKVDAAWLKQLPELGFVSSAEIVDELLVLGIDEPERDNPELVRWLVDRGARIRFVGEKRNRLEDVYLRFVQKKETPGESGSEGGGQR